MPATDALLALAVGNFASTFAESHSSLLFIRSLTGFFGVGPNYALAIAALSDTTRRERNFSIAVVVQVGLAMLALAILPTFIADFGPAAAFLPERAGAAEDAPPLVESRLPIWMALGCQATWYLGVGGIWAFVERMGADAGIVPSEGIDCDVIAICGPMLHEVL